MFITIEKACEITGRSKNVLYRLMAKGHINFVRCTKGKRYLEVAELRRVYSDLNVQSSDLEEPIVIDDNLLSIMSNLQTQLTVLTDKVDRQTTLIEALTGGAVSAGITTIIPSETMSTNTASSPEKDPEWPPFITCYADLAKRDEIKARYDK